MNETDITEKWLSEHVKPTYELVYKRIGGNEQGNEELYASVIGSVLDKAITPRAFWASEQGLKELVSPYNRQNGAKTALEPPKTDYPTVEVPNTTEEPKPVKTDFSAFGAKPTGNGFGDWNFAPRGTKVIITADSAVVTWTDGKTDTIDLTTFQKKVSKANKLYYQGRCGDKDIRLIETKMGWGVSIKGGA